MAKVGRPSTYDPKYCDAVKEFLAGGYSVTAFAGDIGVSRATIFNWANEHPEFLDALKEGQAAAVKWWEGALHVVAKEGKGNATACIFGLKNRASDDWADKVHTEITGKNGGAIETKDLTERPSELELARRIAFVLEQGARATKD